MSTNLYRLAGVIEAPIISEKSTINAEKNKCFAFKIHRSATKKQVKASVELMFKVEVDSVRVLNVSGKKKKVGRSFGTRSDWKKAYVKLKSGYDIEFTFA
ncbi:MAG: 50S ribosomal protein L23 [Methylobacter sp.]|nr:50S ribosomal protein L23 [Methylococcales bacterium]MDD5112456.1 50S ribosomal protein L23 [Methylobacter sp.]